MSNSFIQGFGLAVLAAAASAGKTGLKRGAELLQRRLLVDVEVTRNDEAYGWLLHWISAHHGARSNGSSIKRSVE